MEFQYALGTRVDREGPVVQMRLKFIFKKTPVRLNRLRKDTFVNTPATTRPIAAPDHKDQAAAPASQSATARFKATVVADPARLTTLDAAALGTPCVLSWLRADGVLGQRLADLGFFPGARLCVVRRAPLADPLEVDLEGVMVCIRKAEAAQVEVLALERSRAEARP